MKKTYIAFFAVILWFFCISTSFAATATYSVTSKWPGGSYVNIFYNGGGAWQAVVTYTQPMKIDNITNGTYTISGNTITFTPTVVGQNIGTQLNGSGDPDPATSYVLVNGTKVPFTGMPVPPPPVLDTYYLNPTTYLPTGRIKLGQAELANVWGSGPFDVQWPNERKLWAMALAHASQLFKNVTGVQNSYVGPNHYVATAVQESRIGADPASNTFTYPIGIKYPIIYQPAAQTDGFFQIEGSGGGSAFGDLKVLYPNRFGTLDHDAVVGGARFTTSAITAAYYNIYMYQFLVGAGWKPKDFFSKTLDRQALDRVMALVYNRGAYSDSVSKVFTSQRAYCQSLINMADTAGKCLPNIPGDYGSLYVRQVPGFNVSLMLAANTGVVGFPGVYTTSLTWNDINAYLDSIAMLYPATDIAKAKAAAQAQFNAMAVGGVIDYTTQFGPVLDKIMLALPVDSPANKLCTVYGLCNTTP